MAEQQEQIIAQEPVPAVVEVEQRVLFDVPQDDQNATTTTTTIADKEPLPVPDQTLVQTEPLVNPNPVDEEPHHNVHQSFKVHHDKSDEKMSPDSDSGFQEETTRVSELPEAEKKALETLKHLIRQALNNHEFTTKTSQEKPVLPAEKERAKQPSEEHHNATKQDLEQPEQISKIKDSSVDDDGAKTVEAIEETVVAVCSVVPGAEVLAAAPRPPEEVSIWGIPLLADDRSDTILLKFLRARDFKVKDAFTMIKNTIQWRKDFGIEALVDAMDNHHDLEKTVFMHGFDKEGHPVCYNVYGEFQNKQMYQNAFSDEEKRLKFLKWRIQFLERSIRKLDFKPGGICTIVQINDLKNSPGPGKWELRLATKQALHLLQDNYPEFVAKQVFINVPWWYLAVNKMISAFLTQRTKSKFVFAGPSKSAETLLRYIAAEQVPVKFGGLSKDGEFDMTDCVSEAIVEPASKHTVEFPVTETSVVSWEVRVVGWDVSYGAEFVPSAEESYTVIIQKPRKFNSLTEEQQQEAVICNSFKPCEPGQILLTIHNPTSKKKKLLYRFKSNSSSSSSDGITKS